MINEIQILALAYSINIRYQFQFTIVSLHLGKDGMRLHPVWPPYCFYLPFKIVDGNSC